MPRQSILKKPKVILFDWDNTLADTWSIIHKSLEKTFVHMGVEPMSFQEVKRGDKGIHGSLRNSFPKIFGDKWQEARQCYFDNFLDVHLDEISIMVGAQDVLDNLKAQDISLSIVSNKTGKYLRQEIEYIGWGNYFVNIIGATDAKDDKPSHHPVALALENTLCDFDMHNYQDDIWLVGDSKTDLETASNAAIVPFLFGDNQDAIDYHLAMDNEIKLHARNHADLLNLIKDL